MRIRVATKFSNLTRRFLLNSGISDHTLVHSSGATELSSWLKDADIITDLTWIHWRPQGVIEPQTLGLACESANAESIAPAHRQDKAQRGLAKFERRRVIHRTEGGIQADEAVQSVCGTGFELQANQVNGLQR